MSAGWETVGLDGRIIKKVGSGPGAGKIAAKKEAEAKKRFAEKAPKFEDVLSYSDVASVYSAFDASRVQPIQNGSKSPKVDPSKQKKAQEKKPEKKDGPKVEPKPKNLNEAVKKVSATHLKHLLTTTKTTYPSDPLLWVRDAAAYFNLTLTLDSNELQASEFQHFSQTPLSVLNKETKKILTSLLEQIGDSLCVTAFETFLANMSHDMAKGHCVQGYLIFLQLLSDLNPNLCLLRNSTSRFAELRNSYQNRPNIGTALLWVVGLGGKKDLQVGLKVWIDFMLPLLPLKHYSRFVVDYLKNLLKLHNVSNVTKMAKGPDGSRILYPPQFLTFFDAVFVSGPSALHKEVLAELVSQYKTVKALSVGDCGHDHELFPEFLRRLEANLVSTAPQQAKTALQAEVLNCLEQCLVGDAGNAAVSHWKQMYRAYLIPSSYVLQHLDSVWDKSVSKKLSRDSNLEDLIEAFEEYNESCSPQKEGILIATTSAKSLLKKMSKKSSGGGWFPWKLSSLLLVFGIAYLVNLDVSKHGSFFASNTGKFLRDVGYYNETVQAYATVSYLTEDAKQWAQINVPIYVEKSRTYVGPAIDKAGEVVNSGVDFVKTNIPVVTNKINEYLPGIKERLILLVDTVWHYIEYSIQWIRANGMDYLNRIVQLVLQYAQLAVQWLKQAFLAIVQCGKDIIEGKIDLKDVKNAALAAFDSTTKYGNEIYQWTIKQVKV